MRLPDCEPMLFEVERVLQRRRLPRRNTEYFVKWTNVEDDSPSWEDYSLLGMCQALVCAFSPAAFGFFRASMWQALVYVVCSFALGLSPPFFYHFFCIFFSPSFFSFFSYQCVPSLTRWLLTGGAVRTAGVWRAVAARVTAQSGGDPARQ